MIGLFFIVEFNFRMEKLQVVLSFSFILAFSNDLLVTGQENVQLRICRGEY